MIAMMNKAMRLVARLKLLMLTNMRKKIGLIRGKTGSSGISVSEVELVPKKGTISEVWHHSEA